MRSVQLLMLMLLATSARADYTTGGFFRDAGRGVPGMFGQMDCASFGGPVSDCTLSGTTHGMTPDAPWTPDTTVGVFGKMFATSSFGDLTAAIWVDSTGFFWDPLLDYAIASFSDTATVNGYAGSGFIQYNFSISGHAGATREPALFQLNGGDLIGFWAYGFHDEYTSELYPFDAGQVELSASISARVMGDLGDGAGQAQIAAHLDGVSVFDADMNRIPGATITPTSSTAVPEPSALLLLATAVMLGVAWRARQATLQRLQIVRNRIEPEAIRGVIEERGAR